MARAHLYLDDLDAARTAATESLEIFERRGDELGEAQALIDLGAVELYSGAPGRARVTWERAAELAERHGDLTVWAEALNNLGALSAECGRVDDARRAYLRAIEIGRQSPGDRSLLAWPLTNLAGLVRDGTVHRPSIPVTNDQLAQAEAMALEAIAVAPAGSYPQAHARVELLGLRSAGGRAADTIDDYSQLVLEGRRLQSGAIVSQALAGRAAALTALNRYAEAVEDIREAVATNHPDPVIRADHLKLAADVLQLAGQVSESLARLGDHLSLLESLETDASELGAELLTAQLLVSRAVRGVEAELRRTSELEQLAFVDELTGVRNRRAFSSALADLVRHRSVTRQELVVALVDVDHLKTINDEHLHATGDAVLRTVASTLDRKRRPGDVVARYGGDEFALAFAGVDAARGRALLDRLRLAVEQQDWSAIVPGVPVTVSIGGAVAVDGEDDAALLDRADRALYAAKAAGRNAVVLVPA